MKAARYTKKKHRLRNLFIITMLFIVGYIYFQYQEGVRLSSEEVNEPQVEYEFNGQRAENGSTNVLILGSDARDGESSRADTMMIASYQSKNGTYKLISIMRDVYVMIPGYGKNKLNAAFAFGGPELLRQTIKENFDIDLQYYAILDFQGFIRLVDTAYPKGLEVDVEKSMSENIDVTIEPGKQRLDGEHLLGYVRFRQDATGDFGRVERQQKVMTEMGSQLTIFQTIAKLPKLIGVVTPYVHTNMDAGDILWMSRGFLSKEGREIETLRIPVANTFSDQRVSGVGAVLSIDLEENKQALKEFYGK